MTSGNRNILELERLFIEYYSAVLLYSITIVKNKDDAEDIVQQAFISLWQKIDSLDFHTSARAYLYKIVYNSSLDFLKHQKVKKRYENETIKSGIDILHSMDNEEKELHQKLRHAVNALPEQCGRIFKMSRFDGLTYKKIATDLNISEKTVENQMGKALKMLRAALKDYLQLILLLLNFWYVKR